MRAAAALLLGCAAAVACGGSSTVGPAVPAASTASAALTIAREDFTVASAPGISIAVHAVLPSEASKAPMLLVHGAGGGAIASFDLPVAGGSLAEDLARQGHPVYAVDIRGWGGSTRPVELSGAPDAAGPAARSAEAVADVAAAVVAIRARHGGAQLVLLGWATGGHWAGMYAATHPDDVAFLVMLNALYGVAAPWSLRAALEDPAGQLAPLGAYRRRDAASLIGAWERSIPVADHDAWRDPKISAAYTETAIASDPTARDTDPPTVRVPSGPLHDSYLLAIGTKLWSAGALRAPVLLIRGGLDFWSRRQDVEALRADLAPSVKFEYLEIPEATHFVHLDRAEHGRAALLEALRRLP